MSAESSKLLGTLLTWSCSILAVLCSPKWITKLARNSLLKSVCTRRICALCLLAVSRSRPIDGSYCDRQLQPRDSMLYVINNHTSHH